MNIGMSLACFYPMEPENVVPVAAQLGVQTCEVFLNTLCEIELQYLNDLKMHCDKEGMEVYSIHPFTSALENYLFFMVYDRRINDAKEFYRKYADTAKILRAKVVNIHGDRGLALTDYDQYLRCLNPLLELQRETGIIFALENVFYNSINHPEIVEKLRKDLPDLRFTFDIKQANKGGTDPYTLLEAMGDAVVNVHINDFDATHLCMLPGEGTVDYGRIFSQLKKVQYKGPLLIEVYRDNFNDQEQVKNAKNFLEQQFLLAK